MGATLRRRSAVLLLVWAVAFSLLAAAYALPTGPTAVLVVSDAAPFVGEAVAFNASGSLAHDSGNGRIVAYAFDFGDGSGTGWTAIAVVHHAYNRTGNVTATVTVRDDRGLEGVASASLRVRSPPLSPFLVLERAAVDPAQPRVGDDVTVTVTVVNRGNATATAATVAFVDLRPDGISVEVDNESLRGPVAPNGSVQVSSSPFLAVDAGNHTIRIFLRDVAPLEPGSGPAPLDLPVAILAAGGQTSSSAIAPVVAGLSFAAAGAGLAALYLLRRRPPGPLEPPPASPPDRTPPPIWPP